MRATVVAAYEFLRTIPWQWVIGILIPVGVAVYAAWRNQRQARRLFRKQVEYASYSRLAESLAELSARATTLYVFLGSLADELARTVKDEEAIRRLAEGGQTPQTSPDLWARTKLAEGARERWRKKQQELFSKSQALSEAHIRFGREFEHHEIFFTTLHRSKEDLGFASLRLHSQVGELSQSLFRNSLSDPPYPTREECDGLIAEARRLAAEGLDLVAWTSQLSRLLQDLVLRDVAGKKLNPLKVGHPDLVVLTKDGLVRAGTAGLFDPKVGARADELGAKGPDALWEDIPTNHPRGSTGA